MTTTCDSTVTLGELYEFVIANKGTTTFMGYSNYTIMGLLKQGLDNNTLLFAQDFNGKVCGMILADKDDKRKILFVTENLSMTLSTLKQFAKIAKERWSEYRLEAIRHTGHRKFNTSKLYNKLGVQ